MKKVIFICLLASLLMVGCGSKKLDVNDIEYDFTANKVYIKGTKKLANGTLTLKEGESKAEMEIKDGVVTKFRIYDQNGKVILEGDGSDMFPLGLPF